MLSLISVDKRITRELLPFVIELYIGPGPPNSKMTKYYRDSMAWAKTCIHLAKEALYGLSSGDNQTLCNLRQDQPSGNEIRGNSMLLLYGLTLSEFFVTPSCSEAPGPWTWGPYINNLGTPAGFLQLYTFWKLESKAG